MKEQIIRAVAFVCVFLACAAAILLTGCAAVRVSTPKWSFTGASLFKSIEVPTVMVNENGSLLVSGYKGNVDGAAIGEAAAGAVKILGGIK